MKTLDEVIKAWSICFSDNSRSDCTGCPYADEDGEAACFNHDRTDALIYLKAYQWQMTNPDGDHLQLEKCRALLSDFYRNDPLSWDELRTMEGKPVWYEHEFWKGWIILGKVEQGVNCEMIPDREEKWYIVKDGSAKAYRKER